ncbi:MAG TPA: adenosylcobinamide-phosphate synthase CbiB, partial [Puia sp.]
PHPVRVFGWLIAKGEAWLNHGHARLLKGAMFSLILTSATFISFYYLFTTIPAAVYYPLGTLFVFYGLAHRQLIKEGQDVFNTLQQKGLDAGRQQLSRIVGRDTRQLSPAQIRIAVMETMSENLSDGVIGPLFFYACAGVPGMMTYKMINTLDSMIGYRNSRYELFGKFAARLDDIVNFIPARLTAILIVLVTCNKRALFFIVRYGRLHKSPNAGYPEAALAGILDARFGGTNIYHGVPVTKPFIGSNPRELAPDEIKIAVRINHKACLAMVLLIISLCLNIS